jgi:hypothetical protein
MKLPPCTVQVGLKRPKDKIRRNTAEFIFINRRDCALVYVEENCFVVYRWGSMKLLEISPLSSDVGNCGKMCRDDQILGFMQSCEMDLDIS